MDHICLKLDGLSPRNATEIFCLCHFIAAYLHRYAKHLGSLQGLEITKEDDVHIWVVIGDGFSKEHIKEDVHMKDYVPSIKAICDRQKENSMARLLSTFQLFT